MKYSIIVPVFNRPDEVDELLESLCQQEVKDFEVIIVEDGSSIPCKDVCDKYAGILDLHYYFKENSGPGQSRNYGAERANGDWLIVLDSDVVLPNSYLESVECRVDSVEFATAPQDNPTAVAARPLDACTARNSTLSTLNSQLDISAFGGPDASHPSFTPVQKAISYSMTSFFTTGGIRGGKGKKLDKFFPRSYNMGIRREVYQELGGFSKMRFGEDIDFSYRIVEAGYKTALIPEAWVWHKRRTDFRKFFRQVSNSGRARINLEKRHPGTMKLVHLLPTVFTLGVIGLLLCTAILLFLAPCLSLLALSPIILYSLIICIDSSIINKSLWVGVLSIPAAFVQLIGYGLGFIEQWWKRCVLKQPEALPADLSEAERQALEKKFYK
ncbi:MAG: glycosyltransferase [Prevotella sp.]|nr:glycosyltransferase [Prevotella sp.]